MGLVCSSCGRNREEKEKDKISISSQTFLDYIQNNRNQYLKEQQHYNDKNSTNKQLQYKVSQINEESKVKQNKGLLLSLKKKTLNPKDRIGAIYNISNQNSNSSQNAMIIKNSLYSKEPQFNNYNMQSSIKSIVEKIPLLTTNQGPRDDQWINRLKEEYLALIKYVEINKQQDNDWFKIESDKEGKKWKGKCWYVHNLIRYEFDVQFEIPATYPAAPIEIELPELDGKTPKMYRGGKICQDIHFAPLWQKNSPKFGIAHALALGLGPWLAAEVPMLIEQGVIKKD